MKIEAQKPNIVRIAYHQEKSDPPLWFLHVGVFRL